MFKEKNERIHSNCLREVSHESIIQFLTFYVNIRDLGQGNHICATLNTALLYPFSPTSPPFVRILSTF